MDVAVVAAGQRAKQFNEQLLANRAALSINQLKRLRKKRSKLFQQAVIGNIILDNQLISKERKLLEVPELSASSHLQHINTCMLADTADTAHVLSEQTAAAVVAPAAAGPASSMSGHAQTNTQLLVAAAAQQATKPPAARLLAHVAAFSRAANGPTNCAVSQQHTTSCTNSTTSSRGPCRVDLSSQLVVIQQQLSGDLIMQDSSSSLTNMQLNMAPAQHQHQHQHGQKTPISDHAASQPRAGQQGPSRKRLRPSCQYGNYHHYYGYRLGPSGFEDPRLKVLDPTWFKGADVLDIGCNEGLLILALAVGCGCRSVTGVDIDAGLVAKACTNLSRSRTAATQQLREAVAVRDAGSGRRLLLPSAVPTSSPAAAVGGGAGPLSVIAASSAALRDGGSTSSSGRQPGTPSCSTAVTGTPGQPVNGNINQEQQQQQRQAQQRQAPLCQQPGSSQQQQHHHHHHRSPLQQQQLKHCSLNAQVVELDRQIKALSRVTFKAGNWLDMPCLAGKYDVVTCFSVTKWIHLNWGDDGIMKLFHKFYRCLAPGGLLVLEPQPFKSYKNAVHKQGVQHAPFREIDQLKLRPEAFLDFLTERVKFELVQQLNAVSQVAGKEAVPVKGFDRPILVLRKPL